MGQHTRIMLGNDIIHSLNQLRALEHDVPASLLKIAYRKIFILEYLRRPLLADMFTQPGSDIVTIFWDSLTVQ